MSAICRPSKRSFFRTLRRTFQTTAQTDSSGLLDARSGLIADCWRDVSPRGGLVISFGDELTLPLWQRTNLTCRPEGAHAPRLSPAQCSRTSTSGVQRTLQRSITDSVYSSVSLCCSATRARRPPSAGLSATFHALDFVRCLQLTNRVIALAVSGADAVRAPLAHRREPGYVSPGSDDVRRTRRRIRGAATRDGSDQQQQKQPRRH